MSYRFTSDRFELPELGRRSSGTKRSERPDLTPAVGGEGWKRDGVAVPCTAEGTPNVSINRKPETFI